MWLQLSQTKKKKTIQRRQREKISIYSVTLTSQKSDKCAWDNRGYSFNAFQKWFSFLLRVTCVIFARAIDIDVWQAIIARSEKNCGKPPYYMASSLSGQDESNRAL